MKVSEMSPRGRRLYKRCKEQLGYTQTMPQPHAEMLDFFSRQLYHLTIKSNQQKKAVQLEPRGTFKTSDCTIGGVIDALAEDPNLRILIGCHTHDYAMQILSEIKWHFERNEKLREEIGDVRTGAPKWAEDAIILATRTKNFKEPSIDTCALDKPKVGGHYDLILIDDLHTRENITPKLLRKAKAFIRDLFPVLEPGGVLCIIGTRWHHDDIYGWLFDLETARKKKGAAQQFEVHKHGCYDGPGGLYFPTRLTAQFLDETREGMTDKEFACQYLNEPIEEAMSLFPPSLIQRFDGDFVVDDDVPYIRMTVRT